jgi:hypothetical protein
VDELLSRFRWICLTEMNFIISFIIDHSQTSLLEIDHSTN